MYLEAIGSYTNQAFADFPLDEALITEVRTGKGEEPIRVWEVSEREYEQIRRSEANSSFSYRVYRKAKGARYVTLVSNEDEKLKLIRATRKIALIVKSKTRKSA